MRYSKADFCGDRQWLLNGDFSCNRRVLYLIKTYNGLSIPEAKKSLLDQNCTCVVGDGVGTSGADHGSAAAASSEGSATVARASTIPAVKEDVRPTYDYDYSNTSTTTKKVVVALSLALLVMTFGFRKRRGLVTRARVRARASRAKRVPFAVIIAIMLFTARNIFYALSCQYMDTYIKYLQSNEVQNNCIKEVEQHLQQAVHTLQAIHICYYMYDDPDITLTGETRAAFELSDRNGRKDGYKHEEENDRQMILALEKSSLRTFNANEAQLFIPPIPMSSILISKSSDFKTPMDALLNHPIFQRNLGNNHLLISTCFALHRYHYRAYTQMKDYYHLIYNMTTVQSWDPVGVHNDLFHNEKSSNWGDYHSTLVKEEPTSLSRRSISVGLGSSNHDFPLNHATMEKFNSSTNFIFYHSRTGPSFNNSTIYRHAPITNITLDNNFPKSSIGWGLDPHEWLEEFSRSQFCLMIRGDSPHSHALWRSIRVGCIPVIISKHLPVYAPIFKSTLNMSDYAVILDEEELLQNATKALLTLREMTMQQVEIKLLHLAFAQRVLFTDHPESLFVPALLKEAIVAEEVVLEKKKIMRTESSRTKKVKVKASTKNECTKHRHRACKSESNCIWNSKNLQCTSKSTRS